MNQSKISVRYAKAFFQFAIEKDKLALLINDIKLLDQSIREQQELRGFIQNPIVKPSQKKIFVQQLLSNKVAKETIDFLNLIISNKRELFIQDILRNVLDQYRKYSGITAVTLSSAQAFSLEHKQTITAFVEKKYNTKVELLEKTDVSLLGGFILRIEDLQFDASIQTKLKQVKKELLS